MNNSTVVFSHAPRPPANKRKLFEKAQLKRQYAKLLRKDAANGGLSAQPPVHIETADVDTSPQPKNEAESGPSAPTVGNKEKKGAERRVRRQRQDGHEEGAREHNTLEAKNTKSGKIRREHRPDPFKEAKVNSKLRASGNVQYGYTYYACIPSNQHAVFLVLVIMNSQFDTCCGTITGLYDRTTILSRDHHACCGTTVPHSGAFAGSERSARPLEFLP